MNNVLSLVHASRSPFEAASTGSFESLRSELLLLHEEMIAQLRLERLSGVGTAEFIKTMIDQHEHAAAVLRTQLEAREANPSESPSGPR
jgi:hypothetical protein